MFSEAEISDRKCGSYCNVPPHSKTTGSWFYYYLCQQGFNSVFSLNHHINFLLAHEAEPSTYVQV